MANTPAFQYYPADLLSDPEVMFWNMEAVGCYWQMITYLWLNGGKFEYNLENLCKLFRVNHKKTARKLWEKISKKFIIENGQITHKRILKEMQKQAASRLRRSEAGKKGMDSRWKSDNNVNNNVIKKTITNDNPSSSTSTSTSVNNINNNIGYTLEELKMAAPNIGMSDEDVEACFHHYNAQGWNRSNGLPIKNVYSLLNTWKNNRGRFTEKHKVNSGTDKPRTLGYR